MCWGVLPADGPVQGIATDVQCCSDIRVVQVEVGGGGVSAGRVQTHRPLQRHSSQLLQNHRRTGVIKRQGKPQHQEHKPHPLAAVISQAPPGDQLLKNERFLISRNIPRGRASLCTAGGSSETDRSYPHNHIIKTHTRGFIFIAFSNIYSTFLALFADVLAVIIRLTWFQSRVDLWLMNQFPRSLITSSPPSSLTNTKRKQEVNL